MSIPETRRQRLLWRAHLFFSYAFFVVPGTFSESDLLGEAGHAVAIARRSGVLRSFTNSQCHSKSPRSQLWKGSDSMGEIQTLSRATTLGSRLATLACARPRCTRDRPRERERERERERFIRNDNHSDKQTLSQVLVKEQQQPSPPKYYVMHIMN